LDTLPLDYSLPPLALTLHEALLLRLALSSLSQLGATPFKQERESLLAKVQTLLPRRENENFEQFTQITIKPGQQQGSPAHCERAGRLARLAERRTATGPLVKQQGDLREERTSSPPRTCFLHRTTFTQITDSTSIA
jgi:hypothetical protein